MTSLIERPFGPCVARLGGGLNGRLAKQLRRTTSTRDVSHTILSLRRWNLGPSRFFQATASSASLLSTILLSLHRSSPVKMPRGRETDTATSEGVVEMSDTTALPVAAGDSSETKAVELEDGAVSFPHKVRSSLGDRALRVSRRGRAEPSRAERRNESSHCVAVERRQLLS